MTMDDNLVEEIEDTRILYPESEQGFTITGSPFICKFGDSVDPESFCETITTAEDPWNMFGLKSQISDDYWKVVGTLFHVEEDDVVDTSKLTCEVTPEWVRVYVKEQCSAERAAEFVRTLDDEFGVSTEFVSNESDK